MKLVYKFIITTVIALFHVFSVQATHPKLNWQAGQLTLWDKTILEGDLCYNWLMETVVFRQADGRVRTFSANQVCQFGWFDFAIHKHRDFRVLTRHTAGNQPDQAFFEICMDGPLTVVRRLRQPGGLRKYTINHPVHFSDQPTLAQNTDYFDYFVYDAGRLLALDRFYTDIYTPLMTTYAKQLKSYVLVHNINDRSLLGRLLLIDRYNWFVEQDARTASARSIGVSPE